MVGQCWLWWALLTTWPLVPTEVRPGVQVPEYSKRVSAAPARPPSETAQCHSVMFCGSAQVTGKFGAMG